MRQPAPAQRLWCWLLAAIVLAGILSRIAHTGILVLDKYLGDALYAAMLYVLIRLTGRIRRVAMWTAITMTAVEVFQLTGVPARMLRSQHLAVQICARLLGTQFSVLDLLAYGVGIVCITALDRAANHP